MSVIAYAFVACAFVVSALLTPLLASWARRRGVIDRPGEAPDRKDHRGAIPLLGGLAVYGALLVTLALLVLLKKDLLLGGYLLPKHLLGIMVGGLLLMIGGILDDRKPRRPSRQILWPILAALTIIASGIGVNELSNPFGNVLRLDLWSVKIFSFHGTPYFFVPLADALAFLWLLVVIYTTKFLDGLDGLVSGITVIGMVVLFALSMMPTVGQPETALLALLIGASFLGFLLWNFYPAKIFLGEGGSTLAGFLLGTLAILSGGKIATALLILGIPILDLLWVVARRFFAEHRPITEADRKHLHFRLLDIGLSHRAAVLILYLLTAIFGSATLFFHGIAKLLILLCLGVLMVLFGAFLVIRSRQRRA